MRDDHQAVRAAARGGFVVVLRNESCDGLGELAAERRAVRWRAEANLGINREGREALARLSRATNEIADLANDARAQGDQVARGQPIDFPIGIDSDGAQCARRHHIGGGRRDEQPFREAAPFAFLGEPDQPVRLERAQVVVHLLPRQPDPRCQSRRRGGGGQLGEEPATHRLQRDGGRRRIIDDLDVEHEEMVVLTIFIVKGDLMHANAERRRSTALAALPSREPVPTFATVTFA